MSVMHYRSYTGSYFDRTMCGVRFPLKHRKTRSQVRWRYVDCKRCKRCRNAERKRDRAGRKD